MGVGVRPSWVEVDLQAVASNVEAISEVCAPASVCAVVKADAYGHGDVPVAEAALGAGAEYLAVALVEEGARLREAGILAPILLLSEPPVTAIAELLELELLPTVYSSPFLSALSDRASAGQRIHLKVDTGMHRVGADEETALALAKEVAAEGHLEIEGVWTHFPVADTDAAFTFGQIAGFRRFVEALHGIGVAPPLVHAANTPGTLMFPEAHFDMVRVGLGMYGLRPTPDMAQEIDLRPAMRVVSRVVLSRRYQAGTRLSYGRSRPLPADSWVATVPVGYADGLWRPFADLGGQVLIRGQKRFLAGSVTMDQIVVDCGPDQVEAGEEVVLIGRQGDEEISADDWARLLGTINYEVVCRIGPRMPRRFQR